MAKISILVDDPHSWFITYANDLCSNLSDIGNECCVYNSTKDIPVSDICFMLSCTKIVRKDFLDRNKHNIVVHASDLPRGKGFTPLKWQILEGVNDIPLTLFEAVEACDAGPYYIKDTIHFNGHELIKEMQHVMALKIIDMCLRFTTHVDELSPIVQSGESTYYPRFKKEDDCLDVNKTIAEHFNHFRIADNDRFPLFFEMNGHRYSIVVEELM